MNSVTLRSPNLAESDVPCVVRVNFIAPPSQFKNGGLARAAEAARAAGRGGDEILLHINPTEFKYLKAQWGEPSTNPHTGLPEYNIFHKIKKGLKFEKFRIGNIFKGIKKQPLRLFTGALDPLGTKIANKVLGKDWKPLGGQFGEPTEQQYQEAEAKGIDTRDARMFNKIAKGIAQTLGAYYGGTALGKVGQGLVQGVGATGSGATTAEGLAEVVPTVSKIGTAAEAASAIPASAQAAAAAQAAAEATTAGAATVPITSGTAGTSGALSSLGKAAGAYAKDPKNWPTIVGALGALGSGGPEDTGAPPAPDSPGLKQLPFMRQQTNPNIDWYTYGEHPEAQFYSDNTVPVFTPDDEEKPKGSARGGLANAARFVRGPGSGRSDSIDARLSDGEYVLTAEDVALLGDGSSEAGAKRLDEFRANLRRHKGAALARGKISPNAKAPMAYLKGTR